MFEDPTAIDESDVEFQSELFELFRALGWKVSDIRDADLAQKYEMWLERASPAE